MDAAAVEAFSASATAAAHLLHANVDTSVLHMSSSAGHLATVVYNIGHAAASSDAAVQVS